MVSFVISALYPSFCLVLYLYGKYILLLFSSWSTWKDFRTTLALSWFIYLIGVTVAFAFLHAAEDVWNLHIKCVKWSMTDVLFSFQLHTTEAAKLETEVTKAQNTITAAQQLISQLDGEHRRWNSQVTNSECIIHNTPLQWFLCLMHFWCMSNVFLMHVWYMSDACPKYTGGQGATIAVCEPIISHNFSMFLKFLTSASKEFCLVFVSFTGCALGPCCPFESQLSCFFRCVI